MRLRAVPEDNTVATSIISRILVLQGRFDSVMKASNKDEWLRAHRWLNDTKRRLSFIDVVQVDEAAADRFEELFSSKKPRKMDRGDLLIASIALARKATLVTRNVKDFKWVPGLKIENWAD